MGAPRSSLSHAARRGTRACVDRATDRRRVRHVVLLSSSREGRVRRRCHRSVRAPFATAAAFRWRFREHARRARHAPGGNRREPAVVRPPRRRRRYTRALRDGVRRRARARHRPRARVRRHGRDGRRFALRRRPPPPSRRARLGRAPRRPRRDRRGPRRPRLRARHARRRHPPPSRSLGARRAPAPPRRLPSPSHRRRRPRRQRRRAVDPRRRRRVRPAPSPPRGVRNAIHALFSRPPRLHHGRPRGRRRHHLQRGPTLGAERRASATRPGPGPGPRRRRGTTPGALGDTPRTRGKYHARHVGGGRRARVFHLGRSNRARVVRPDPRLTHAGCPRDRRRASRRLRTHRPRVGLSRGERGRTTAPRHRGRGLHGAPVGRPGGPRPRINKIRFDESRRREDVDGDVGRPRRRASRPSRSRGVARVDPSRGERPRRARHRGRGRLHQTVGSLRTRRRRVVGVVAGDVCVSPARRRRRGGRGTVRGRDGQ